MSNKMFLIIVIFYIVFRVLGAKASEDSPKVKVTIYDVGQGDSILLEIGKSRILIDGGPSFEADRLLKSKFLFNNCHLDAVLLTHPHKDHVRGINRVLEHCIVDMVIYNDVDFDSQEYLKFKQLIEGVELKNVKKGDVLNISGVKIYVLWPEVSEPSRPSKNVNNDSVVVLLDYGDFEALLMGDLEQEASNRLDLEKMREYVQDGLDIYKVPHQGSIDSLNRKILSEFKPKICALSVGKFNNFGHPHPVVLESMESQGCKVYRTDIHGTIELYVD